MYFLARKGKTISQTIPLTQQHLSIRPAAGTKNTSFSNMFPHKLKIQHVEGDLLLVSIHLAVGAGVWIIDFKQILE